MRISRRNLVAAFAFLSTLGLVGAGSFWADRVIQGGWRAEEKVRFTKPRRGELNVLLRETASLKPRKVVEIKSKVSGRILGLPYEAGSLIRAGSAIAEVADLSQIVAVAKLSAVDVGGVTPGDSAVLTVESRPPVTLKGRVESIAPTGTVGADGVTFDVKIALLETSDAVKPEMMANADILVAQSSSALKIPLEAIETGRGGRKVKVLKGKPGISPPELPSDSEQGREGDEDIYLTGIAPKDRYLVEEREIRIGLSNEIRAEVVDGLDEDAVLKLPDPTPPHKEPLRLF